MAGSVKLYKSCKEHGIKPYPGVEGYLIDPAIDDWENPPKGVKVGRYHFGLLALDETGYKALVKFVSLTHTRPRFNRFARASLGDLLELGQAHGDHLALTTGCFFGIVQQSLAVGDSEKAHRYVDLFSQSFPHTFVEVQNHNILHSQQEFTAEGRKLLPMVDTEFVSQSIEIADDLGLPIIATQDSHYLEQKHKQAHGLMKRMVYAGDDDEFPGDSFHLATTEWVAEHYTQPQWDQIEEGFGELLSLNNMSIGPLDNYRPRVPKISDDPHTHIVGVAEDTLADYLGKNDNLKNSEETYWARLDHELDVIEKIGMSEYFVIVEDFVQWCGEQDIFVEARGSANGSLVCFMLGITQVDPLEKGGLFERFLSVDRIKPPDIDMDIEDERRGDLLEYLLEKYKAVQIGTWGVLGSTVDQHTGEETGSVMVSWFSWKRREAEKIAAQRVEKIGERKAYAQAVFQRTYGHIKTMDDVAEHFPKDYVGLRFLAELKSVYKSYGTHAGGVLLSGDDVVIEDYIPTMLVASSDTRVTQYDMNDVEEFGLLKMDILGQSSLRAMKLCQENMGRTDPTDFTWIPEDDNEACKVLRSGRTETGVFHYEAYTKSKGGREMKIKSTDDAILGSALYMPGAMDSGQKDLYLKYRFDAKARKQIKYLSKEFEQALAPTYGAVIYQEQVIEIMRNLGMDPVGVNKFFKIVKDSGKGALERNAGRLAEMRIEFDKLCDARGITRKDEAWELTTGFAAYGFNRAHAAGYGIRSYRTAYLKAHYPVEYMAGLLQTWAGRDKEKVYAREARRVGIRLLPPDINISGPSWTIDPTREGVIRKGLVSIPGVGFKAADAITEERDENGDYESIEDMIERLPGRALTGGAKYLKEGVFSGILEKLYQANALDSLED